LTNQILFSNAPAFTAFRAIASSRTTEVFFYSGANDDWDGVFTATYNVDEEPGQLPAKSLHYLDTLTLAIARQDPS